MNNEEFETFLDEQEHKIQMLMASLEIKKDQPSLQSESKYTTSPLSKYNDRIIEFDEKHVGKSALVRDTSSRMRLFWPRRAFILSVIFLCIAILAVAYFFSNGKGGHQSNVVDSRAGAAEERADGEYNDKNELETNK